MISPAYMVMTVTEHKNLRTLPSWVVRSVGGSELVRSVLVRSDPGPPSDQLEVGVAKCSGRYCEYIIIHSVTVGCHVGAVSMW